MDFEFTLEQKLIQDSSRKIFEKFYDIQNIWEFIDLPKLNKEFLSEVVGKGFLGILSKEKYGGLDLGAVDAIPILFETGKFLVPYPLLENILASKILSDINSPIANSIIQGEIIATICWSELKDCQIDFDTGKLSGTALIVPFANDSDVLLVPVNISNSNKNSGKVLLFLNLKNKNVKIQEIKTIDLTYPSYKVTLDNYILKEENIVGGLEKGNIYYNTFINLGAILSSAEMAGASEKSLEKSIAYTKERVQFGQPIGKFQALKHLAAECYVYLEGIKIACEYAAWTFDKRMDDLAIQIVKGYSSEKSLKIIEGSIQMHGGIGFTWENEIHLYLKRVLRASQSAGNSYEHYEVIARNLLTT